MIDLASCEPGIVPLTPSRFVHWTGRVAIGLRFDPRYVEQGSHALMWQTLLTTALPKDWHQCPRVIETKPAPWKRLLRLWSKE